MDDARRACVQGCCYLLTSLKAVSKLSHAGEGIVDPCVAQAAGPGFDSWGARVELLLRFFPPAGSSAKEPPSPGRSCRPGILVTPSSPGDPLRIPREVPTASEGLMGSATGAPWTPISIWPPCMVTCPACEAVCCAVTRAELDGVPDAGGVTWHVA